MVGLVPPLDERAFRLSRFINAAEPICDGVFNKEPHIGCDHNFRQIGEVTPVTSLITKPREDLPDLSSAKKPLLVTQQEGMDAGAGADEMARKEVVEERL